MRVNIQDASQLLSMTPDEMLMEVQNEECISAHFIQPTDMIYNEDGTVQFVEGAAEPSWEFEMTELIELKKIIDRRKELEKDKLIGDAVRRANEEILED